MMKLLKLNGLLLLGIFMLRCSPSLADAENITVADVFGDNMVLQREMKLPVWGTGEPGGTVTVSLD